MKDMQLAIMRNGPTQYRGDTQFVHPDDERLAYPRDNEFGHPGAIYDRTEEVASTSDGPAVVFEYVGENIPQVDP
jgi:hypothetical protein